MKIHNIIIDDISLPYLPDKYNLPFRIDMTVNIDSPAFHLKIGKGLVSFATGIMNNRRITDILGEDTKPNTHIFDNDIPLNEYVDISVTFGKTAMWVFINDELRCFSKNDRYIKALKKNMIPEEFNDGFCIGISCDKRTQLTVKTFTVTEFENEEPVSPTETFEKKLHPPCLSVVENPTIEECIKGLSSDLQKEVLLTDEFLLNELKKNTKFRRKIEGGYPCSKITYKSRLGLTYIINISDMYLKHGINWNGEIYYTDRELKSRCITGVLNKLAEESAEFADKMFYFMQECTQCSRPGGCIHAGVFEYNGRKKFSCGGRTNFIMFPSDFEDFRKLLIAMNSVLETALIL